LEIFRKLLFAQAKTRFVAFFEQTATRPFPRLADGFRQAPGGIPSIPLSSHWSIQRETVSQALPLIREISVIE
jgi:hypothetical protein